MPPSVPSAPLDAPPVDVPPVDAPLVGDPSAAAPPVGAALTAAALGDPLAALAHRPWPLPRAPWALAMRWCHLAFLHWPVRPAAIAERLPAGLAVDTWDGWAWLGVVPFVMRGVRWRGLPPMPGAHAFPELNLRTYVRWGDRPGVWFFALDCASRLAVRGARVGFGLPYNDARMTVRRDGDALTYTSERTHRGVPPARFAARYRPVGPPAASEAGSFEHWLTERYRLYARPPLRRLAAGEVHHAPWPLQPAECELDVETLTAAAGLAPERRPPVVHYAAEVAVRAWWPRRLR